MIRPTLRTALRGGAATLFLFAFATAASADDKCREGNSGPSDALSIAGVRAAIDRECPCSFYDGSDDTKSKKAFQDCTKPLIAQAIETNVLGFTIRKQCKAEVKKLYSKANCGFSESDPHVMCCELKTASGKASGAAKTPDKCVNTTSGSVVRNQCTAYPFSAEACSFDETNSCTTISVIQETVDLASPAEPAETPGTSGVVVSNPKLISQFGGTSFSLNQTRYTRYHLASATGSPDAILVLVPGFEGGAGNFRIFAENLIERAQGDDFQLEIWAYDRRSNQLEDSEGLEIAEEFSSPVIAQDWLFGGELGLTLHPALADGPNRRAVFYDAQADVPFIANWTPLTFARDIDVIIEAAAAAATNGNVFLGGHSMGTTFTARYASTDFDLTGGGPADPGYAKVRGLVLLEGGGGSTSGTPLTADTLDRIEAKFDGGLFGAVRDNAARCVDGTTPCTISTEATDCTGQIPPKCTLPTTSYAVSSLLNARILSAGEVSAIQSIEDPDRGANILGVDQGTAGNNAIAVVPDLSSLSIFGTTSAFAGLGGFVDDDGVVASLASFVATSVGGPGTQIGSVKTWRDITEGVAGANLPNNGAAPTTLPAGVWGQEKEVTRMDRLVGNFYVGETNFTDTYFPSSGLSVTSVTGVCGGGGTCTVGNVGAVCSTAANCTQSISLDSTALSVGRGRRDIENLTQAANVNVPVIAFGGSNGLATVPGAFVPFASSIGVCTAPSCDGTTPRVVDASTPNAAFPTFGNVAGGFEAYIAEGFAHVDVLTAEDDADNPIPAALIAFLERNAQ